MPPLTLQKVSSLQSELFDRAQQLHYKVEADEQQLCEVTNLLAQATQLSVASSNKRIVTKHQVTTAHERVKMLLAKKSEVEKQLKLRQSELRFLQQLQGYLTGSESAGWDREGEELGEVLIQKDEEVKRLQDQLREVEKELGCAREEACSLREELQRVTVELAEKSARVQELERARDKLEESVNWQRKLVEMSLIQSTAAASSNEALLREIKVLTSFICGSALFQPNMIFFLLLHDVSASMATKPNFPPNIRYGL